MVLTTAQLQQSLDMLKRCNGNMGEAAKRLGVARRTFYDRIEAAKTRGIRPSSAVKLEQMEKEDYPHLRLKVKHLESELRDAQKDTLTAAVIKNQIIGLRQNVAEVDPPGWMFKEPKKSGTAFGVPTLLVSDLHAGEVVDPSQVNGVNEFNLRIFDQRLENLAESSIRLMSILSPKLDYPGIILDFAGDNVSGNIHDELTATNEMNTMPTVLHLFERIGSFIKTMAAKFGRVHIEWTTGNHGRDTRKIWTKDRHHTSFDWLLGCFLAKHFSDADNVSFHIPDGPDAHYKIYDYAYCLTHGDQFRSFGDSMIGALGPIIRGDLKKRSRDSQIGMDYQTLVMGHWHQYIHLTRLIVNGSIKGYDEFANAMNYAFERPQQALWLTHPRHGITYRMPVYVDRMSTPRRTNWVSVAG